MRRGRSNVLARRLSGVVAVLLLALGVAACSSDDDGSRASGNGNGGGESASAGRSGGHRAPAAKAEEFSGSDDAFYTAPDPLPRGDHGTLIRYQRLPDRQVAGGQVWRVMYLSESVAGDPIVDTGTVVVPSGSAPAGGWKLLTIAHGTTGVADQCAPSKDANDITTAMSGPILEQGYVVATTDYEGLGTPGVHPYLVGESEGRAVIDAATAARQLPGVEVGKRYAVFGYSQGGHAAVWANQVAADWAPDLDLVGTVAGAPPSEMQLIFQTLGQQRISPDFFYMMVDGFHAAYPDAAISSVLTPAGQDLLPALDHDCYGVGDALGTKKWSDMVQPGFAIAEPWPTLMAENDPGQVKSDSPLLILHSAADDTVPAGLSLQLFNRLCGRGQVVERRVYNKGQTHIQAVPDAVRDGFAWIEARMAGTPARSTCPP
jgi:hypothetical protein